MSKSKPVFTLSLSLLINLIFSLYSFAQNNTTEEIMTFETYYPAPYGVYNEMRSKKMAIGDTYYNGSQYCWSPATCSNQIDGVSSPCWPNCNTDLVVEGNVGIGTASPVNALEVYKQSDTAKASIGMHGFNAARTSGRLWEIRTPASGAGDANFAIVDRGGDGEIDDVNFVIRYDSGNVGIGTIEPQGKLHVASGYAIFDGTVGIGGTSASLTGQPLPLQVNSFTGADSGIRIHQNAVSIWDAKIKANDPKLYFSYLDTTSQLWLDTMVLDNYGNVGIGTASPDRPLVVRNNIGSGSGAWPEIRLTNNADWVSGMALTIAGDTDEWIVYRYGPMGGPHGGGNWGNNFCIGINGVNEPLCIRKNGDVLLSPDGFGRNVGIGTMSPGWLLHVNGAAAKPGGGSWTDSSDIRLKKNVKPIENALDKMLALEGISFEWDEPERAKLLPGEQIGMIAQEVEKVFPQWVGTDAKGYKDLTFRGFEALVVETIRKLKAENDGLKARIEALEAKMTGND